jgi:mRNA-decapping enzyme 1B
MIWLLILLKSSNCKRGTYCHTQTCTCGAFYSAHKLILSFFLFCRDPYLIFRQDTVTDSIAKSKIMGVWFHEGKERENISTLLRRAIRSYSETKEDHFTQDVSCIDTTGSEKVNYNQAVASLLSSLRIGSYDGKEVAASSQPTVQQEERSEGTSENAPLDKKSLQLALLSLIQDDRFLDIIHAQYLRVVKARDTHRQQNNPNRDKK